jgi:hypothetical protein
MEKVSSDEAKKVIEEENQEKVSICSKEINDVLTKYKCRIDVTMVLKHNQVLPIVSIVLNQE